MMFGAVKNLENEIRVWYGQPQPPDPNDPNHPSKNGKKDCMFEKNLGENDEQGYYSLGWSQFNENMKKYADPDLKELLKQLIDQETGKPWSNQRIDCHLFLKNMQIGDIIIARGGTKRRSIYGIGIITSNYKHKSDFDDFKSDNNHYREVKWIINFYNEFRNTPSEDNYFFNKYYVNLVGDGIYLKPFPRTTLVDAKKIQFYFEIKDALLKKFRENLKTGALNRNQYKRYLTSFNKIEEKGFYSKIHEPNYWIFQSNPDKFNLEEAVKHLALDTFTAKQTHFKDKIKIGDYVFFWVSKEKKEPKREAGIVGYGNIIKKPSIIEGFKGSDKYLIDKTLSGEELRVWVSYYPIHKKLLRSEIKVFPEAITSQMKIMKLANETNFEINKEVWDFIMKKIQTNIYSKKANQLLNFLKSGMNLY